MLPAPCSLLPVPCSLLPAPCSLHPAPCSLAHTLGIGWEYLLMSDLPLGDSRETRLRLVCAFFIQFIEALLGESHY